MRRTKIVATVGPATSSDQAIHDLVAAGVDVFRLNFSHGTHETHRRTIEAIRAASSRTGRMVAVLQDLSGPKIRTGRLRDASPLLLKAGDKLRITVGNGTGEAGRIFTTYPELAKVVERGRTLLLDDGRIQLRVDAVSGDDIETTVVDGGELGEHKGINAPGVSLPTAALTPKDFEDLAFGVSAGVDFVALSFVRSADDLRQARNRLRGLGAPDIPLVAKLERPEALGQLDDVMSEADVVMVARGDLGLEIPLERVPRVQKDVTHRARAAGIPVIVATQVFDSMRTESRPTRAEVSDAANAVAEGVDAIMLAGETAVGLYPLRTVQTLDAVMLEAEAMPPMDGALFKGSRGLAGHGRAMCEAAVTLAIGGDAAAIVAVTRGGKTARALSALRPRVPIFAATDNPQVARRLMLPWGVVPIVVELPHDVTEAASRIGEVLVDRGSIPRGSVIVLVSITPDLARGPSNVLKLQRV